MTEAADRFRTARDELLARAGAQSRAVAQWQWPEITGPFNFAVDVVDAYAWERHTPGLVVVEEDGSTATRSFHQLSARSHQLARHFTGLGVRKGDRVVVMLGNQVELWESMLALISLGAVILPTTVALGPGELAERVARAGARHVLTDPANTAKFRDIAGLVSRSVTGAGAPVSGGARTGGDGGEPVGAGPDWVPLDAADGQPDVPVAHPGTMPQDPLLWYFTSGTTSRPKLVAHTQVSYPVGHLTTMYWIGLRPGDVHCNISAPGWAKHAWSCFFAPLIAEATIVVSNYGRFDAAALLTVLRREAVTTFCAPPTVWRMLIQADLSGGPGVLREVVAAGEPLNPEVITRVRDAWGLTVRDGFGQTETSALVGNAPGAPVKPGSMGRPLPGCPVVLVDPRTGAQVGADEGAGSPEAGEAEGEICLDLTTRPMMLMAGYQGDPELDAEAVRGGYYHTGDLASRDAEGYITYVGRTDDVFKASDYKISPFELESVLVQHPAVVEAAVVPAPDQVRLAVPKAYVVLADGWSPDRETALSIFRHARAHLAPFQRVRRLEFADLPKTISGKIRRVELREREERLRWKRRVPAGEWREDQFPELHSPEPGAPEPGAPEPGAPAPPGTGRPGPQPAH